MKILSKNEINEILEQHKIWLKEFSKGKRADLSKTDLSRADLSRADLRYADLTFANLTGTCLCAAILNNADLNNANLTGASLNFASLNYTNLSNANLCNANLRNVNLRNANLKDVNLTNVKGLIKIVGVEPGGIYWKRFDDGLKNNEYQFKVGLNKLRDGEVFADDERELCSFPGFHFASRSWCASYYPLRPLEAKIRIPLEAKINEPWATNGKASADMIEILQVFDTITGEDVTKKYK